MPVWRQIVWLGVFAALPALATALWHPGLSSGVRTSLRPHEVTLETVRDWKQTVLWIDARSEAEFQRDRIPGAVLLNESGWEQQIDAVIDAWQPGGKIVVYCGATTCDASAEVARRLRDDYEMAEVYFLHGGWSAWQKALQ